MNDVIAIGGRQYRILTQPRGQEWLAQAEEAESGRRFGIECAGATETEASQKVARWLEWQRDHAAALDALQKAERDYHRTIAGSAFASPTEGVSAVEMQKESLEQVEAARVRLDEIRGRQPQ